jgi:hypothetical protein
MASPDYEREVLTRVAGTPYEAPARQMITSSYIGATHGSLPLPDQEQRLRGLDAFLVGATAAARRTRSSFWRRARSPSTSAQAYKENPWAAATRFGRQIDVPEAQITSPEQVPKLVAQRLPLMTGVETYRRPAGVAAAAQRSQGVRGEARGPAARRRAEVLAQTGAMLTAPRAIALADQLDKHDKPLALALKMGLDRTTAGRAASALVLRGAQALADKTVKKDDSALAGWKAEIAGAGARLDRRRPGGVGRHRRGLLRARGAGPGGHRAGGLQVLGQRRGGRGGAWWRAADHARRREDAAAARHEGGEFDTRLPRLARPSCRATRGRRCTCAARRCRPRRSCTTWASTACGWIRAPSATRRSCAAPT